MSKEWEAQGKMSMSSYQMFSQFLLLELFHQWFRYSEDRHHISADLYQWTYCKDKTRMVDANRISLWFLCALKLSISYKWKEGNCDQFFQFMKELAFQTKTDGLSDLKG